MTKSLRPALILCAAAIATGFAPAQAGPNGAAAPLMASASLPRIAVPDLLSEDFDPQLSGDEDLSIDQVVIEPAPPEPAAEIEPDPKVSAGQSLSSLVDKFSTASVDSGELECLAIGIYFESKGEPLKGQLAVGEVIANRAESARFPSGYCSVLKQRGQFSFVRNNRLPSVNRSGKQWKTAVAIARIVDSKLHESVIGKALFFHARYVSPKWRLKRVAAIGNHVFYR